MAIMTTRRAPGAGDPELARLTLQILMVDLRPAPRVREGVRAQLSRVTPDDTPRNMHFQLSPKRED